MIHFTDSNIDVMGYTGTDVITAIEQAYWPGQMPDEAHKVTDMRIITDNDFGIITCSIKVEGAEEFSVVAESVTLGSGPEVAIIQTIGRMLGML